MRRLAARAGGPAEAPPLAPNASLPPLLTLLTPPTPTPSRLYFEPITVEDVLNVIDKERPEGIIVQFGGQTPLKIANDLQRALDENPIPAASGERTAGCGGAGAAPRPPHPALHSLL
jgi:hypothetical protein